MCEQLAVYLAKFKTPVAVTAAAESSAAVVAAPPEGYKVRHVKWRCCAGSDLVSALSGYIAAAQARLGEVFGLWHKRPSSLYARDVGAGSWLSTWREAGCPSQ